MLFQNASDETLVMLTLAGEQAAYECLVTRYQRAVIASAMTVTKTRFMAEDAAQDAFVTAWMKLNTLQEPNKYASWVCRIAKNCALNMVRRFRSFIPLDEAVNSELADDRAENPAELYARSEERNQISQSMELLPEKVRQIISLYYFEDLSIAEIADRMRISEGTVKWQLHDGRKRIRKELCAMDEKYGDTLIQRVMKKVEELKLWQVKNDKSGFEKEYHAVLREVEELPECAEKQHALADVLMRGWWWLPGKKNDALFARIADAAMQGKNEEVMTFITAREDSKVYGGAQIDFIRDKQIPRLEKAGFVKTLGREWFWLGYHLFDEGRADEGRAAYGKAKEILATDDACRILVPYAERLGEKASAYRDTAENRYFVGADVDEYRMIGGKLHHWSCEFTVGKGELVLGDGYFECADVFRNASACDGNFFTDIAVGETYVGSDGTKLSYVSDTETVETPSGRFENCQLWEVRRFTPLQKTVRRTYYKDGVGIVRQDAAADGTTVTWLLRRYEIKGGNGLLPLFVGNTWDYETTVPRDTVSSERSFTVSFADSERVLISSWNQMERMGYDKESWAEAAEEIAQEYYEIRKNGRYFIRDVTPAIERAERLAATPMEKAHTKAAASAARRIMATDPIFNPDHTATGHWNFFGRVYARKRGGSTFLTDYNSRWSFEWKNTGNMEPAETPILFNDIFGILQDATNCVWSDEWRIGAAPMVEYTRWDRTVKTQITCEDGGTVVTKAGTFEHCFKLCLDIGGMEGGLSYRGGRKAYYFADGVGIVRTENEYCGGAKTAVYELTSYEGTGDGYMPLADGLVRRYDALDLTDGFVGSAEYSFVCDEDGDIVIFSDRTGIRVLPPPITQYGAIQGEIVEQRLWDEGKWQEGHAKYAANSFHLLLHLLARPSRNRNDAKRSIELQGCYMRMMELLGDDGNVPPAWMNLYAWTALIRSAALFGDGQKELGYDTLEIAIRSCEKTTHFKEGDLLDTGNRGLLGDVKYEYGKGTIRLPDGTREPVEYDFRMNGCADTVAYCLTAPRGWEWFNSVRGEERFLEYVKRAKKLVGKV